MDKFLSLPEVPIDINTKLFPRKKLGSGTFGDIYLGLNTQTNATCAIKCEEIKNENNNSLLKYEANILQYLQKGRGIPDFYAYISKEKYNFMLFELLGPSLEDLFDLCQQKFSLKTILQLGDQIISRIEFLH
jgi:serine/threonine protein kinase